MDPEVSATARFYRRVYAVVRAIPHGHVTTYGAIANGLGAPGYARHVGTALAAISEQVDVPAYRVVNRSGVLTGQHAFGAPGAMRAWLEAEGVTFRDDGRADLRRHLWLPPFESWQDDP